MKPTKVLLLSLLLLAGLMLSACTGNASALASSWPGVTVDQTTAYIAYNQQVYAIDTTSRTEKWRFPAETNNNTTFYAGPVLTSDNQLIAGSYNHSLYSINPANGSQNWVFAGAKSRYIGSPLAGPDAIYAPNSDNSLYALDYSGNLLWSFKTGGPLWATPVSDPDCSCLFVPSMDHFLYSIDAKTGLQQWKSEDLGGSLVGTPAYVDGFLYAGTFNSEMLALDATNGKIVWRTKTDGWVWGGPLHHEGKLYFGDVNGSIYAIDVADGGISWKLTPDGPVSEPPLLTADGLYFSTQSGSLVALTLDGTIRWNIPVGGKLHTTPALAGELILAAPVGTDELFFAYNASGAQQWPYTIEKK